MSEQASSLREKKFLSRRNGFLSTRPITIRKLAFSTAGRTPHLALSVPGPLAIGTPGASHFHIETNPELAAGCAGIDGV